jgi:hypothetical protein
MKRFILILCLALLFKIQLADYFLFVGRDLYERTNLPHRSLGLVYAAYTLEPHRRDYAIEYFGEYFNYSNEYSLIEGQTKPVIPFMSYKLAQENIDDEQLQAWSGMFRQWVKMKRKNVKLTMTLHENGETITAEIKQ